MRRTRQHEIDPAAVLAAADAVDPWHQRKRASRAVMRSGGAALGDLADRGGGHVDALLAGCCDRVGEISVSRRFSSLMDDGRFHDDAPFRCVYNAHILGRIDADKK